jgi:hypothetical protein
MHLALLHSTLTLLKTPMFRTTLATCFPASHVLVRQRTVVTNVDGRLTPCATVCPCQALSEESARLSVAQEQLSAQQQQVTAAALRASSGGSSPSAAAAVAARAASLAQREAQLLQVQQELTDRERHLTQVIERQA